MLFIRNYLIYERNILWTNMLKYGIQKRYHKNTSLEVLLLDRKFYMLTSFSELCYGGYDIFDLTIVYYHCSFCNHYKKSLFTDAV